RMGDAARPAVPALTRTLRCACCPKQQQALVEVLKELGPNARIAAADLQELALKGRAEIRGIAQEALGYVRRPDWIGVRGSAGILSEKVREDLNVGLAKLSDKHHVVIVAETVSSLPPAEMKQVESFGKAKEMVHAAADRRCREVGADQVM